MQYERIRVQPIAPSLGAEVSGVDLCKPVDDPTLREIHGAWMQHLVLFFRDQPLDRDQHLAFGQRFGELHIHPVLQQLADQGYPEIVVLESDSERPYVAAGWHSDVTFERQPPLGSILHAVDVPGVGGDTMWANMYAAYDALSGPMQRMLGGLRAVHSGAFFRRQATPQQSERLAENEVTTHPVIRTHPVTGKQALFVNSGFTQRIEGVKPKESRALLSFLFDHLSSSEFTCRFHWSKHAVAMWDNRCTQHRVIADNLAEHRRMERVTLVGDTPV